MEHHVHLLTNKEQCNELLRTLKQDQKQLIAEIEKLKAAYRSAYVQKETVNNELMDSWHELEETEKDVAALSGSPVKNKLENKVEGLFQGYSKLGRETLSDLSKFMVKVCYRIIVIQPRLRENYSLVHRIRMRKKELMRA